jgi:hypothetical protein
MCRLCVSWMDLDGAVGGFGSLISFDSLMGAFLGDIVRGCSLIDQRRIGNIPDITSRTGL